MYDFIMSYLLNIRAKINCCCDEKPKKKKVRFSFDM